jgi:N-methylhydantoinase A
MDDYSVAVDVGGTFTDIVLCNLATNEQRVHKTPSTPDDPSTGFLTGLREVLAANSVKPSQVKHVFHGTTIATNAILENKGSPVGLVVPEGFKFVLEIGRHGTPRLVNPQTWVKPDRPVRPRDIVEVAERAGFNGEVLIPLDEEAVRAAARKFRADEIASIAVSFLHSYANPEHENRAKELILEEYPSAQVSISSEVLAVFREYERTMTTVLNAYVMPRVSIYIGNLESSLRANAVDSSFSIMKSNGGMIGADIAVRQPVHTALSGPAAGVMAALQIAENTGVANSISFDMGGTSTDVSLLREGRPTTTLAGRLGTWPIQLPMLDIATIGCGGGSIANVSPYGSPTGGPARGSVAGQNRLVEAGLLRKRGPSRVVAGNAGDLQGRRGDPHMRPIPYPESLRGRRSRSDAQCLRAIWCVLVRSLRRGREESNCRTRCSTCFGRHSCNDIEGTESSICGSAWR